MAKRRMPAARKAKVRNDASAKSVRAVELICIPSKIKWGGPDREIRIQAKEAIFKGEADWYVSIGNLHAVGEDKKRCLPTEYASDHERVIRGYEIDSGASGDRTIEIYECSKGQDISLCETDGSTPCDENCEGNCICDAGYHEYDSVGQPLEILK